MSSLAISSDGSRIVTGSWDNTARIWDAKSGAELAVLKGHEAAVSSLAISSDGSRIVTGSHDTTARIWLFFKDTQSLVDYAKQITPSA